jgi:pimeloyl-ACP methyl ester carboxylesterase
MHTLAASGFHVVAPDQRGFNLSEKPRSVDAYRLDTLADDIADLANVLGRETFHIVGHDWGGSVAWSLASRHNTRLCRMVVLNAPHPAVLLHAMRNGPSKYVRFLEAPWLPETVLRLGHYDGLGKAFATARPEAFKPEVMQAYHDTWRKPGAVTPMLNWYRALLRRPVTMPAPGTLSTPCLILWGDTDPFAIPQLADESAILCTEAKVVHLSSVGHWIIHDARETVIDHLRRFFQEVAEPRTCFGHTTGSPS